MLLKLLPERDADRRVPRPARRPSTEGAEKLKARAREGFCELESVKPRVDPSEGDVRRWIRGAAHAVGDVIAIAIKATRLAIPTDR